MPHAILEYSANLSDEMRACNAVAKAHQVMLDSGLFAPVAVKSRSHATDDFHVGTLGEKGQFLHVLIYLLEGRTPEQKLALTKTMVAAMSELFPQDVSLSVDIRDLDKAYYQKN